MSAASPGPDIVHEDDSSIMVTFGGGRRPPTWPQSSPASRGTPGVADISTSWYSEQEDCEGQDFPDDDHCFPMTCVALLPARAAP